MAGPKTAPPSESQVPCAPEISCYEAELHLRAQVSYFFVLGKINTYNKKLQQSSRVRR